MPRKAYTTFEEFVERASRVGLQAAWDQQYRGTGRTVTEIARAVHHAIENHSDNIVVYASNTEIAVEQAKMIQNCLKALGVQSIRVYMCTPGKTVHHAITNATKCIDHTYKECAEENYKYCSNLPEFYGCTPGA